MLCNCLGSSLMRMSWAGLPQPPGLTLRLQQSQDVTCIGTLCISHITVTLLSLQILVLAFEHMQSCKYSQSAYCCHQGVGQHGKMHPVINIYSGATQMSSSILLSMAEPISPSRTGPLTFLIINRFWSSRNLTRTCVTCTPVAAVRAL